MAHTSSGSEYHQTSSMGCIVLEMLITVPVNIYGLCTSTSMSRLYAFSTDLCPQILYKNNIIGTYYSNGARNSFVCL
jgi:hypothetical protein